MTELIKFTAQQYKKSYYSYTHRANYKTLHNPLEELRPTLLKPSYQTTPNYIANTLLLLVEQHIQTNTLIFLLSTRQQLHLLNNLTNIGYIFPLTKCTVIDNTPKTLQHTTENFLISDYIELHIEMRAVPTTLVAMLVKPLHTTKEYINVSDYLLPAINCNSNVYTTGKY